MITDTILDETDAKIVKSVIHSPYRDFLGATPHFAHFVDLCWTFCQNNDEN